MLPAVGAPFDVLFSGINPSLYSAATGHHFARPGNRFWPALHHGGFTGTYLALGVEEELVVAGGAMRLYGTVGPIPADGGDRDASHLVAGADIQSVLLDAALAARGQATSHANPGEESANQPGDFVQCGLQQEVPALEQMNLGIGEVVGECLGPGRPEDLVTAAPDRE